MTTPASEAAAESLQVYAKQLEEFQKAWAAEVGAWLAWAELASSRGPADPDVMELRKAWVQATNQRDVAGNNLDAAAYDMNEDAVRLEREALHG